MIHLDTGFLIRAMVPESAEGESLLSWLRQGEPVRVNAVAWAEFLCGPLDARAIRGRAPLATTNPRDFHPFEAAGLEIAS